MKTKFITIVFVFLLINIIGCVHTSHVALVLIKNDTLNSIKVSSRLPQQKDQSRAFNFLFDLKPASSDIYMKYEEKQGEETHIFNRLGELQLINQSGCRIILNKNKIEKNSERDTRKAHWVIVIKPELFVLNKCL